MEQLILDPAALAAALAFAAITAVLGYVVFSIALMVIARKTGTPRAWLAWIPIANVYLMLMIARKPLAFGLLLVIPFVNLFALVMLWKAIAEVRGKPRGVGWLVLVPVINLLLPIYLARGNDGPSLTAAGPATSCPRCKTRRQSGKRFCESCGFDYAAPAAAASAAPAAAPSPALKVFATVVTTLIVGLIGYAGNSYLRGATSGSARPPAMPQRMAGTLTEFPVDTAASNPARPDSVVSQNFAADRKAAVQVPRGWLPKSLKPETLRANANTMTTASYRVRPTDPPVTVTVLNTADDQAPITTPAATDAGGGAPIDPPVEPVNRSSAIAGVPQPSFPPGGGNPVEDPGNTAIAARTDIAQEIVAADSSAEQRGVRVQTPDGDTFEGQRIKTKDELIYVLSKIGAPIVVVVYASDPSVADVAERLAANVSNGNGLADDPVIQESLGGLPSELPSDLTLVETGTYTSEQLVEAANLSSFGDDDTVRERLAQVRRFIPDRVMTSRYRDTEGRDWGAIEGQYGSTAAAWATWTALRWTIGAGAMQSIDVPGGEGLYADADRDRFMAFRRGNSIYLLGGPRAAPLDKMQRLAGAFTN